MCSLLTRLASIAIPGALVLALSGAAHAASLGTNLITNGDAEAGTASWTISNGFTSVQYGASGGFPDTSVSTAINGGANFFAGGPDGTSSATQTVDVSDLASGIDAGADSITLSGFLGGFDGQADNASLTATFLSSTSASLGTVSIGPVTESDRAGATTLLFRTANGDIPVGTRSILVEIDATRVDGSYNDGYADNLSLVATQGTVTPGVPEPATITLLLAGFTGLGGRKRLAQVKQAIFS
jgi:hypothetical protein